MELIDEYHILPSLPKWILADGGSTIRLRLMDSRYISGLQILSLFKVYIHLKVSNSVITLLWLLWKLTVNRFTTDQKKSLTLRKWEFFVVTSIKVSSNIILWNQRHKHAMVGINRRNEAVKNLKISSKHFFNYTLFVQDVQNILTLNQYSR